MPWPFSGFGLSIFPLFARFGLCEFIDMHGIEFFPRERINSAAAALTGLQVETGVICC